MSGLGTAGRSRRAGLGALALAAAGSLQAAPWVLLAEQGQAPQRTAWVTEAGPTQRRLDDGVDPARLSASGAPLSFVLRLRVVAVHEAPERPDSTHLILELRCGAGQARVAAATAWGRDGRASPQPTTPWAPVAAGWQERAARLACDAAADSGPARTGLRALGDRVIGTDLIDAVWQQVWPDGQRPAYANTLSADALAERKQAGQRELAQGAARLEQEAADQRALMEVSERFNGRLQRMPDTVVRAFQGMAGWTQDQVLQAWGAAAEIRRSEGQVRIERVEEGLRHSAQDAPVAVVGAQGQVLGQSRQTVLRTDRTVCRRVLILQPIGSKPEPRVVDFQSLCS